MTRRTWRMGTEQDSRAACKALVSTLREASQAGVFLLASYPLGSFSMDRSPLIAIHRAAGARLTPPPSEALLTYGSVPAEYRAAREACVLLDDCERGRLRIQGSDAEGFLHRILSSHVRSLVAGRGQRSMLLSGKGKVLFEFDLYRSTEGFVLSVPAGKAQALAAALDMYLFSEKLEIRDASADYAPLILLGPQAESLAERCLGLRLPGEAYAHASLTWQGAPSILARTRYAGQPALRCVVPAERVSELWQQLCTLGAQPTGWIVRDALRVEATAALYGTDVDDTIYPQEARLEEAFSLDKGCYIGQEVVAKIDTYGGLNKRLCTLQVSHDDPVPAGTRLYREDEGEWRDLGVVTSWAYSFQFDSGAVLAYIKRRHQEPGTQFRLGEGPATATLRL